MERNTPLEPDNILQSTGSNLFDLQIDNSTMSYLGESARWAKFLGIIGFVFCGLIVLVAIFAGSIMSMSMGSIFGRSGFGAMGGGLGAVVSIVYIAMALLLFFPSLYMFRFASKMQVALRGNDQIQLNASFRNLKSWFKFYGIFCIIMLGFYLLVFIFGILGSAFR